MRGGVTGAWLLSATILLSTVCCARIDDHRIPSVPVNIQFTTQGMWDTYGVTGAMQHKRFIKKVDGNVPSNFPYSVATYTGYGGVLLVSDIFGNALAFDLACPYEVKPDIRVTIDEDAHDAVCPVCGSTYDVFNGYGRPTSGPAAQHGYGLTVYRVIDSNQALMYKVITR